MSSREYLEIGVYLAAVLVLAAPLGAFMARVFSGERTWLSPVLAPLERGVYRVCGIDPERTMNWRAYALAFLAFQLVGVLALYILQRLQGDLPLNPESLPAVAPHLAFNTAISFVSNTNWQAYSGESTLSHLTQALGLTVQNFVSAAAGLAVLVALVRGFTGFRTESIGNFWVDLVRGVLYVLMPLSIVVALLLVSQGVVQTFEPYATAKLLDAAGEQRLALGPAASQVAIKQLGTNGGGFFGVNSAHPFENPTPLSNWIECVSILLIPAACCFMFGRMVRDRRQGWALLVAMCAIFVPLLLGALAAERGESPAIRELGIDASALGNLEGKEVRVGSVESALWATATTAASNGSVNAMHDSLTPLGGLVPMFLMQLGEVVFGGVGSGLYGMLLFAIVAVFIAGLMVGRTPEYLGKKIHAFEMQMAAIAILVPCAAVLVGTAIAVTSPAGLATMQARGPHGFSEILYAFSSASNNNGSAFAGLGAGTGFYDLALGVAMFVGRYLVAVPVLAIAGSLAAKKSVPVGPGTLPTHGPVFVVLLVATVLLVGALNFVPALALGPVIEHMRAY